MPPVQGNLPSLIGGVSQQPAQARLPGQMESVENCWADIVEGIGKRPPTEHLAVLADEDLGDQDDTFVQFVNFGTHGWKEVALCDGSIRLWDLDGTEHTVAVFPYSGQDPRVPLTGTYEGSFKLLSTGNEALLLNKTLAVRNIADDTASQYANVDRWMVHARAGNYSNDYSIEVTVNNGSFSTTYTALKTTSADDPDDIKTTFIMEELYDGLVAATLPATVTLERQDSTLYLSYDRVASGGYMQIKTYDSNGNVDLIPVGPTIQKFSDLPVVAKKDFKVKVIGENASLSSPYYAIFKLTDTTDEGVTFGHGAWVETYGDIGVKSGGGDKDRFRTLSNMPFRLYYDSAASAWTLKEATWGLRTAGDSLSAPFPEFASGVDTVVDSATYSQRTINDIFIHKNRLGVLADNTESFSEFDDLFTFFPATVTAILDTGPISVKAGTGANQKAVTEIYKGAVFEGSLYLFTDAGQLDHGDEALLTPKTISLEPIAAYDTDNLADPIGLGKSIYFTEAHGNYAGLQDLYVDKVSGVAEASNITSHVTKYIPERVKALTGSTLSEALFALSTAVGPYVYPYKYLWVGDQKVQAMWHRWTIDEENLLSRVLAFQVIGNVLYLVLQRIDDNEDAIGVTLEKINLAQGQTDPSGSFLTHLDRRINEGDCSISYSAVTGLTTWVLPYEATEGMKVLKRAPSITDWPAGREIPTTVVGGNLVAEGDFASFLVHIGLPFDSRWSPSTLFHKVQGPNGDQAVTTGRTQVKHLSLTYRDAGTFRVEVTPRYRDTQTTTFEPTIGQSSVGVMAFREGVFSVPVGCRNTDLTIEIINDSPFQARFISAEWQGIHETLR